MTSLTRAAIPMAGLLSIIACRTAPGCDAQNREIVAVNSETIGSFTEGGKFDKNISGAKVLNKRVAACSDVSKMLAKVVTETEIFWIDLTEVKLTPRTCRETNDRGASKPIKETYSDPEDKKEVTSSGIGGCESVSGSPQ